MNKKIKLTMREYVLISKIYVELLKLFPIKRNKYETYLDVMSNVKDKYLSIVEPLFKYDVSFTEKNILDSFTMIAKCYSLYISGDAENARLIMDKLCDNKMMCIRTIENGFWYRVRKDDGTIRCREDMFHIPFDKENMATGRFSDKEHRCLYFSGSLSCSLKEIGLENINLVMSAGLSVVKKHKILSLDFPNPWRWHVEFDNYLGYFPLIFASMVTSDDKEEKEKNYLFPRLLLEWVVTRNNTNGVVGISYSSTKFTGYTFDANTTNYAYPAIRTGDERYSKELASIFELTAPYSVKDGGTIDYIEDPRKTPEVQMVEEIQNIINKSPRGKVNIWKETIV